MKVQAPLSSTQAAAARRANGYAAPGFVLPTPNEGVQNARAALTPTNISNVGALLAAQTIPDENEKRRRATRRANNLLDQLDEVRVATLSGTLSRAHLAKLSQTLRDRNEAIEDATLGKILEEVELRAEVELAKLENSL